MPRTRTSTEIEASAPSGSSSGAVGKPRASRRSVMQNDPPGGGGGPSSSSARTASRKSGPSRSTARSRQSEAVGVPRPLATGGEMRLDDLDDSEDENSGMADDSLLGQPVQSTTPKAKISRQSVRGVSPAATEASFFFSTKSAATQEAPTASSSALAAPVLEPMRVDQMGETPVQQRNRDVRRAADAGELGHGAAPNTPFARRGGGAPTRRRTSGLRDGTTVQPHGQVPDSELFRHCADLANVPRTRVLVGWILDRQVGRIGPPGPAPVLDAPALSEGKSRKRPADAEEKRLEQARLRQERRLQAWTKANEEWTEEHRNRFAKLRKAAEATLRATVEDLQHVRINVDWYDRPGGSRDTTAPHRRPNPINVSNERTKERMEALQRKAQAELDGWAEERAGLAAELARTEALEAQVERMRAAVAARKAGGAAARLPRLADLDATSLLAGVLPTSVLADADTDSDADRLFLEALQDGPERVALELAQQEIAREQLEGRAPPAGKKGRQSKGKKKEVDPQGHDPRWKELEFNADLLRARTHAFSQLDALSTRYLAASATRASEALRLRSQTGRMGAASGGEGDTATGTSSVGRDPATRAQLGSLLGGVGEGAGKEADDSARDLLRAFGKAAAREGRR